MGKKVYEAYKGFILDYQDKELVKFMTDEVKKFLKEKNALKLIIDPYIPNVSRDTDANIVEDGIDNRWVHDYLLSLGYQYNDSGAQVKWCYCLDIDGKDSKTVFNGFKSNTKNYINKTLNKFKLDVRTLTRDQLKEFKKITVETCDRRSFADKSLEYYENMYDVFGDDVTFKICELNCDNYIKFLEEETAEYQRKVDALPEYNSNNKKRDEYINNININKKRIEETTKLKEEKGSIIPLSGAMFMLYGDEIVYLFSGSYEDVMSFCGQYRLQWEIIKYAADNGYKRYNFYGINDVFNPKGKDYGVYLFKKGFNGYVEELLGSYTLDIDGTAKIYNMLRKIKKLFKK
jgi:lipid II:glycine glycyltransferase (peptidoglycan interpeptide bridge formation enzyme)